MWLYKHHTCSDIIDLDHESGRWRSVSDSEKPLGAKVLADLPVHGSYTDEDGRRYYCYWTDDARFIFRTFDNKIFEVCHKDSSGRIDYSPEGLRCELSPSHYSYGILRQGYSDVRLLNNAGAVLFETSYNSNYYLQLYSSDFTAAAMVQELSDWDFFVALKGGMEILAERAESGRLEMSFDGNFETTIDSKKVSAHDLIYGESGQPCSRPGIWAAVDDLRTTVSLKSGDILPTVGGRDGQWVWSRSQ